MTGCTGNRMWRHTTSGYTRSNRRILVVDKQQKYICLPVYKIFAPLTKYVYIEIQKYDLFYIQIQTKYDVTDYFRSTAIFPYSLYIADIAAILFLLNFCHYMHGRSPIIILSLYLPSANPWSSSRNAAVNLRPITVKYINMF